MLEGGSAERRATRVISFTSTGRRNMNHRRTSRGQVIGFDIALIKRWGEETVLEKSKGVRECGLSLTTVSGSYES